MTNPLPDKQPAAETLEEIADQFAYKWFPSDGSTVSAMRNQLRDDVLSCLRDERERAAKIADKEAQQATRDEALSNDDADRGRCQAAMFIAAAIREGR